MRAILFDRFGDRSVLRLGEVERPTAGPGQVVVRVEAAGVGFPDIMVRTGAYGAVTFPHIPGLEVAGTVAAVGPGVGGLQVGDAVMARTNGAGGYAEYVAITADRVLPRPDNLSAVQGAALPVAYLTAWHGLHTAGRLQPGETVLVTAAAGGVGVAAVQLARAAGARVIGAAGNQAKAARVRDILPVDDVVSYDEPGWVNRVKALGGADLVLESVGGEILIAALDTLRPFGRVITVGSSGGTLPDVSTMSLLWNSTAVGGMNLDHTNGTPAMERSVAELQSLAAAGRIAPRIDRTLPFVEAAEAHRLIEERLHIGKLVLVP